eukprot:PRCOL_00004876-RA
MRCVWSGRPVRPHGAIASAQPREGPLAGLAASAVAAPVVLAKDAPPAASSAGRALAAPATLPEMDIVLYQYEVCPFCCKVKAYLDGRGIPYRTVEVNPLFKKEIKFSPDYRKVPIVMVNGEQLNDSSHIIDAIEAKIAQANPPAAARKSSWFGGKAKAAEGAGGSPEDVAKWRAWVNDHLVHLLPPNIYRTPAEAMRSFEYVSEVGNFGTFERSAAKYFGAAAMYAISGRLKKKYGIVEERAELYAAVDEFVAAVGPDRAFHGGDAPDLADMAVYGVLNAVQLIGADTWEDLNEHSTIGPWFKRMQAAAPSARTSAD